MYACETWATTKGAEQKFLIFDRKILRKIYSPTLNSNHKVMKKEKMKRSIEFSTD